MAHIRVYLPVELVERISDYLDGGSLAALARSSKSLYAITNSTLYARAAATTRKSVLFWAASHNQPRTLQLALDAGIDPNWEWRAEVGNVLGFIYRDVYQGHSDREFRYDAEKYFWTALHIAAAVGDDDILQLLIERGGDPDRVAHCNTFWTSGTPLFMAMAREHPSTAAFLLRNGASVHLEWAELHRECPGDITALAAACLCGCLPIAQLLVEEGYQSDINVQDSSHRTPLAYSFEREHWPCFDWLLSKGADVTIGGGPEGTASMLIHACNTGRFKDACRLIDLGVETNVLKAPMMYRPLHLVCEKSWTLPHYPSGDPIRDRHESGVLLIRKLIEKGADIEARETGFPPWRRSDDVGTTPLGLAAYANNTAAVELLLSKGARLDAPQRRGASVLIMACATVYKMPILETVKTLLKGGANVQQLGPHGTALERACWRGADTPQKLEVIKALLDYGALPVMPGRLNSALFAAFRVGDAAACELLVATLTQSLTKLDVEKVFWAFLRAPSKDLLRSFIRLDRHNWICGDNSAVYRIIKSLQYKTGLGHLYIRGPPEIVLELLDEGARCDYTDQSGCTALVLALEQKCTTNLVRKLLANGADPNQGPRRERTPLATAIRRTAEEDQFECVKLLLDAGAKGIHQRFPGRGDSVALLALKNLRGSARTIELLLEHEPLGLHPKAPVGKMIETAFQHGKYCAIQALLRSDESIRARLKRDVNRHLHMLLDELCLIYNNTHFQGTYLTATVEIANDLFACLDILLNLGADLGSRNEGGDPGWKRIQSLMSYCRAPVSIYSPDFAPVIRGKAIRFCRKVLESPNAPGLEDGVLDITLSAEPLSDHYDPSTPLEMIGKADAKRHQEV